MAWLTGDTITSELRATYSVVRLEMSGYLRSPTGLLFLLFLPTGLLLTFDILWIPDDMSEFLVPSATSMALTIAGVFTIGVGITEQRKNGVLKTFLSSPLRAPAYILGQIIVRFVVLAVGIAVMLLYSTFALDQTAGNLLFFLGAVTLALSMFLSLGFFIASRSNSIESAGITATIAFGLIMILNGTVSALVDLPGWLTTVSEWLPFEPAQSSIAHFWSSSDLTPAVGDLLIVSGWFVLFAVLSIWLFRWTPNDR